MKRLRYYEHVYLNVNSQIAFLLTHSVESRETTVMPHLLVALLLGEGSPLAVLDDLDELEFLIEDVPVIKTLEFLKKHSNFRGLILQLSHPLSPSYI